MTLANEFAAAYRRMPAAPGPHGIGDRLAAAAAEVTGVDGVALVVFDRTGLAVPVGTSNAETALAERLQFTVGQGPGEDAHAGARTVVATEALLARSWSAFHDVMVTETPFRSMVALPLTGPLSSLLTIVALFHDPLGADRAPLAEIVVLCRLISAELIEADLDADADAEEPGGGAGTTAADGPVWLTGPAAAARYQVIIAAGMLAAQLQISTTAAVKILKARAYADRRTADDVGADLVSGRLSPAAFAFDD